MNVSCNGLILLLRGRVGMWGGERDEEWRCRQTAFPSRMAASLGLQDTCWDFQWVLSVRALPVLLAYLAQVSFSS